MCGWSFFHGLTSEAYHRVGSCKRLSVELWPFPMEGRRWCNNDVSLWMVLTIFCRLAMNTKAVFLDACKDAKCDI